MLAKRIIPCLDVKNGRTVKGINFNNLLDMGDRHGVQGLVAEQAIGGSRTGCLDIRVSEQLSHTLVYHG